MRFLTEIESRKILKKYGIPMPKAFLAKNALELKRYAKRLGFPLVLKISSPDIIHKTEAKGVIVGVEEENLHASYKKILDNAKKYNPKAKIDGVLVEEFLVGGHEVICGGKIDPQFGPVVMFGGLGGIYTELLKDISFRVGIIDKKEAFRMMKETKGFEILEGFRGNKYDSDSVAEVIVKISKLMSKEKNTLEIDINPLIVKSKGCLAADVRIGISD